MKAREVVVVQPHCRIGRGVENVAVFVDNEYKMVEWETHVPIPDSKVESVVHFYTAATVCMAIAEEVELSCRVYNQLTNSTSQK